MIEIVIQFDDSRNEYKVYEPSTDTLLVTTNLTEALVLLNKFLLDNNMITDDILKSPNISYHIDSKTMQAIVLGNIELKKRIMSAPSSFTTSSQKFGGTTNQKQKQYDNNNSDKKFRGSSSTLSGASGFNSANKKFGGKKF